MNGKGWELGKVEVFFFFFLIGFCFCKLEDFDEIVFKLSGRFFDYCVMVIFNNVIYFLVLDCFEV